MFMKNKNEKLVRLSLLFFMLSVAGCCWASERKCDELGEYTREEKTDEFGTIKEIVKYDCGIEMTQTMLRTLCYTLKTVKKGIQIIAQVRVDKSGTTIVLDGPVEDWGSLPYRLKKDYIEVLKQELNQQKQWQKNNSFDERKFLDVQFSEKELKEREEEWEKVGSFDFKPTTEWSVTKIFVGASAGVGFCLFFLYWLLILKK
jgi:hypothetical protein